MSQADPPTTIDAMNSAWKWALGLTGVGVVGYLVLRPKTAAAGTPPMFSSSSSATPSVVSKLPQPPANALPYYGSQSKPDGSGIQFYWLPVAGPIVFQNQQSTLFTPLTTAPAVGDTTYAVLSFHSDYANWPKDGASPATGGSDAGVPVPVKVIAVDAVTGRIEVQAVAGVVGVRADPNAAHYPVPVGASWSVPSFSWLGSPSMDWLGSVNLSV